MRVIPKNQTPWEVIMKLFPICCYNKRSIEALGYNWHRQLSTMVRVRDISMIFLNCSHLWKWLYLLNGENYRHIKSIFELVITIHPSMDCQLGPIQHSIIQCSWIPPTLEASTASSTSTFDLWRSTLIVPQCCMFQQARKFRAKKKLKNFCCKLQW